MRLLKMFILSLLYFVLSFFCPLIVFSSPPALPVIPLADINDIQDLHYTSEGTGFFICKNNQGLSQCEVWGKQWKFHKPWQDIEKGKTDLQIWMQETRVDLTSEEDGVIYAHKKTGENTELYFRIDPASDGYSCEIIEKITLLQGKSITASVSTEHPTFIFYTIHDGRTMDRLDIDGSGVKMVRT